MCVERARARACQPGAFDTTTRRSYFLGWLRGVGADIVNSTRVINRHRV